MNPKDMHFVDLPDDIFIDILSFLEDGWYVERNRTLAALRLTCKRVLSLTTHLYFSSLRLKIESQNLDHLVTQAESIGHHVRQLVLDLWINTEENEWEDKAGVASRDVLLAALINQLPNVRALTVHALCTPAIEFPQFVQSMRTLKNVQHLQIIEIAMRPSGLLDEQIRCPLSDGVVREVVKSSGRQLRSIVFDGQSSIQLETFKAIRDLSTSLQTLLFGQCLGLDCQPALFEAVSWACRDTLEHLGFYDCRGAHSGAIASGVGSGLWSTKLRTLEVCKSGDHSDARVLPYPIVEGPETRKLSRACFEHAFDWELLLLGRLRAQEVTLTLVPRHEILRTLQNGSFRGMTKLIVGKPPGDNQSGDTGIIAACSERRVDLSTDGIPIMGCTCPYGTN